MNPSRFRITFYTSDGLKYPELASDVIPKQLPVLPLSDFCGVIIRPLLDLRLSAFLARL